MTTQVSTKPATITPEWRQSFYAGLHVGLVTLASSMEEEPYLIRLVGDQIEALGPLPRADCVDEHDHELPTFTIDRRDWQPCTAELISDLNPYGAWYVPQETPTGTRYIQHTQGFQDALTTYLASPEAEAFMDQPWQVGRVPCLLLFPNGSFVTAPDASAQPIVLPLGLYSDAKSLRSDLEDLVMERTWPGSR